MRPLDPRTGAALVAVAAFGLTACGGSAPAPKSASAGNAEASTSASTPSVAPMVSGPAASGGLSGDAKAAFDRGFQAWTNGDLRAARVAFEDAAAKAPNSAPVHYSLGCVLERLGDTQGALDAYRAAYSADSSYDIAIGAYALLLARTGRGPDAEQLLAGKRSQQPDSVALTAYLAEVKSIEGDSPGCQLLAQQALQKQPDYAEAMVVIARDYYRNHRWDLARYALTAILEGADDGSIPPRDPGNPSALLVRGLIERDSAARKQAIGDFEQAAAKRPDLFEANVNLGEMKLEAGNATEAEAPLTAAVRYAPNSAIAHLDLGDCYRLLGRPADARRELDAALAMDSTLAGVHYDLGLLYLFSPSMPGVSSEDDQLSKAILEFQNYKSMRGAKAKGQGDDVDELLNTAKRKQSELQLKKQAAAAASASGSASSGEGGSASSAGAAGPSGGAGAAAADAGPASSGAGGGSSPATSGQGSGGGH